MGRRVQVSTSRSAASDAGDVMRRPRIQPRLSVRRVLPSVAFLASMGLMFAVVVAPTHLPDANAITPNEKVRAQSLAVSGDFTAAVARDNYGVTKKVAPVIAAAVYTGAPAAGRPDPGTAQAIALEMVTARGWGNDQFSCLVSLFNKESGWNVYAANPSGAYGIPQALPGRKMASAGADWATNPATQITWGLSYISGRYGTPCGAWAHSQSSGWY